MTNVMLIAKDRLYRAGIGKLFEGTRFALVAAGASVNEVALDRLETSPDLVLLDVDGGCRDVRDSIAHARACAREVKVVVIAPLTCNELLTEAVAAGADGTLHRDISAEALIDVLAVIMSGEPVFLGLHRSRTPAVTPGSARAETDGPEAGLVARLSERERLVLRYLTLGLSNKDLARKLSITENTVKVHLRRICRLLQVHNRTQAALVGAKCLGATPPSADGAPGIAPVPPANGAPSDRLDIRHVV
jgi:two-component system nitrate/nitrite response regulator NarL